MLAGQERRQAEEETMSTEIRVPALGESVTEATIAQWFKSEGDPVSADEPVVELETDKVTIEVPAPAAGVIEGISAATGDTVEVGALLGMIGEGTGTAKAAPAEAAPTPAASPGGNGGAAPAAGKIVDIVVPSAGESVTEADVGAWMKQVGETVAVDEALVELETDKAAQEVPSPVAGVLVEIVAQEGATVEVGAILARIEQGATTSASSAAPAQTAAPAPTEAAPAPSTSMPPAPSAAKLMAEQGISSDAIEGSGKRGQVLKGDVLQALETTATAPASTPAPAPPPVVARAPVPADDESREERVRMTRLRQTIARRLKDAQNSAAMLTTFNEVDMTNVMAVRSQFKELFEKKHGVKLGFMSFFAKAVIQALKDIPAVNAEIDGTDLVYKNYYHIGVAVGTDKGLVVPVVRNADRMTLADIEQTINDFGRRARDGDLKLEEMQGGTFTISNGGVYGSLMSTPILNAPQSGILGMHKIQQRPMVVDGKIEARPMMYLALSYDHRIVDGKEAVTFLVRVKESLEDPQRMILDL